MRILKISKANAILVSIMMIAILLCCSSQVKAAQDGDYTYTVTDGKAQITNYTGAGGVVTIPSTLGGFPVTSIGNAAFWNCKGVTSISIPQGVTSIGDSAFTGCEGLTSINIPQGVTSIEDGTFYGCGLTSISIPQGVTSIGKQAFAGCEGLTSISIPQGVTSIGDLAFNGCGVTIISIPQGVTSIGDQAFYGCEGLISVSISQGVTSIGSGVFTYCKGLTSITVAEDNLNYKSINGVLYNKTGTILIACPGGLTSISIPQGVTSIGDQAFSDCTGLTSINIPQGVTSIGNAAFMDCKGLTSISIPQGVTSIGDNAFTWCTGLTSVSIPQGVTSIGNAAFIWCTGLKSILFNSATTTIYDSAGTIPDATRIFGYAPSTAKDYAIKYSRTFEDISPITGGSLTDTVSKLAVGGYHSLAIKEDGTLWAWGGNWYGEFGNGTTTSSATPVQVMSGVKSVAAGYFYTLIIKEDGTLWSWGDNESGQLGDGTTTNRATPLQVMSGVKYVSVGTKHTVAIKEDGTLWAWGANESGELGDGTITNRATPVQVMSGVKSVVAGPQNTMAIKEDGTLWVWGYWSLLDYGYSATPVLAMGGVKSVTAGNQQFMAIKEDGTLWAWGNNNYGQLGDGTTTNRNAPVQVMSNVKSVVAGWDYTFAIKEDGTLWAWGNNNNGQLGDGTTTRRTTPVQVMSGVKTVAARYNNTLAIKQDGTLWAWGANAYNQLGDGTTTNRATPVQIMTVGLATLNIATTSLTSGTQGSPYNATITVSGGTAPYTWTATDLPTELSIDPTTGVISGTPTIEGTFIVNIKVTDSTSESTSISLSLTINKNVINEMLTVSNPTPTGFKVTLMPILPGLTSSDFVLKDAQNNPVAITGVTTIDAGLTYNISAELSSGQTYTVTAAKIGYDFGTAKNVIVSAAPITETMTVSNPTPTGFTVTLMPILPGLSSSDFILKDAQNNPVAITGATTIDAGLTYSISAALSGGQNYTLTAAKLGYDFGTAKNVIVSAAPITETMTVSNPTPTGFTVTLMPILPGLSSSDFILKDDQNNPVAITGATTIDAGLTYNISAALSGGQTYTVTAAKLGYDFGTAKNVIVSAAPITETLTVSNPTPTGFTVTLMPILAGLNSSNFILKDVQNNSVAITGATTIDAGLTYSISVALSPGQTYTLTVAKTGYDFGTPVVVALSTSLVYQSTSIDISHKIVTLTFSEDIVNNKASQEELKNAVTFAANGTEFSTLGANDNVAINGNSLVISFNTALTGNTNKIKVAVNTVKDKDGNVFNSVIVTENISAEKTDECFIATAAYGSKLQPDVVLLRQFRDRFLETNPLGEAFVKLYYRHSPPIAHFIANNILLKIAVRALLTPLVIIAYLLLHPVVMSTVLTLVILMAFWKRRRKKGLVKV